ncbi:MAG: hypothetical protein H7070_00370 [Saprospiraceae bacterium]|nr:hypothetical protein [Pyrinomonadaceae bacterium]
MSLRKQQDLLVRLLTDESMRRSFSLDPNGVGTTHGLNSPEIADLENIIPDELAHFAESLIRKRCNEVEKILPLTTRELGTVFESTFQQFANSYNPVSTKKHIEDALEFCVFLLRSRVDLAVRETAKYEQAKLQFYFGGKRVVFRRLRHDVDSSGNRPQNANEVLRSRYCLWVRLFKAQRYWVWSFYKPVTKLT